MARAATLCVAAVFVSFAGPAAAVTREVPARPGALAAALVAARPGDQLVLQAGHHAGPVLIGTPVLIRGEEGAVLDGGGAGRVVTIAASDVTLRRLEITGSGSSLAAEDSGVYVTKEGARALIEENRIHGNLIGVFLKGPADAIVRDNEIEGRRDLRLNERGNDIQVWNSPGSVIEDNDIRFGRDGIFTTTSSHNSFLRNHFEDVRFAIHYMYTNDSKVVGNVSVGNHAAWAIMFSDRLEILDNRSTGHRDHGLLLNSANSSRIAGNIVIGGPESDKCVFIYNANKNDITMNRFEDCQIGVHFTAGSERNEVHENAFINNRTQVKYVGTRFLDWAVAGRGNYWSDHWAFDLDRDGIADQTYRPNDLMDQVLWAVPLAKLLINSPMVQLLRWAQSQFPALHPGGLVDTAPLMSPPDPTAAHGDLMAARP